MNTTKGDSIKATIYQGCNDEFRKGVVIDQNKLRNSSHSISINDGRLDLVINKDAEDVDDIFKNHGTAIPPDEILESLNTTGIKIPMKNREEFPEGIDIPEPELLNALHYYTSKKISLLGSYKKVERSLDETSLIAFGMLVDTWMDDLVDETTAQMFLEPDELEDELCMEEEHDENGVMNTSSSSSEANSSSDSGSDSDLS